MSLPLLEQLREQVALASGQEGKRAGNVSAWGTSSSGTTALDAVLPAGGLRGGTLVEWLAAEPGAGTTTLAVAAARKILASGRPLVIVDSSERSKGRFHPPGVAKLANGQLWNWRQVLLVRAEAAEGRWAVDQALRTSGVGAVLFRMDYEDERWMRRWQLAAERSGTLGLVVRRLAKQPEACFADLRILVTPLCAVAERRVRLQVLRCRQGSPGTVVEVSLSDVAHSLPPVPASSG
ncbi:MAG: hypothetical protein K8U03_18240 [Planctomycetia bacterium]|nr:hypothetical protein [Planctomycetia bacterium]